MNRHVLEMGASLERAAALRAGAAAQEATAARNQEEAASHEAGALELHEEATGLLAESRSDAAAGGADQAAADELGAAIEVERGEAAAHASLAATEEAASDAEGAEAMADASEAAQIEARARGEEIGVAFCELVPVLDVACDVVGGVTSVGLEAGAAAEAVRAASEAAAAAASKADEEREAAWAVELEGKVVEDGAFEGKMEQEAMEMESRSREEQLLAQEKEAAAQGLATKAEEEEALAVEEEIVAKNAEAESVAQTNKALTSGVVAAWNGIMASLFGIVSFSFFLLRSCTSFLIPATRQAFESMAKNKNPGSGAGQPTLGRAIGRDASYVFHHFAIFIVVASTFQYLLAGLAENSVRARGGIILCFALTGGFVQALCLHVVPNGVTGLESSWKLILHLVRRMLVLPLLFTTEILIVWVVFGGKVFAQHDLTRMLLLVFWISLAVSMTMHVSLLEIPRLRRGKTERSRFVADAESSRATKEERGPSETDSLLFSTETQTRSLPPQETRWFYLLWDEIQSLQLPFELLILSCLFVIIFHSVSSTRLLWPASKAILISTRPVWLLPVAIGIAVALLCLCIISMWCG